MTHCPAAGANVGVEVGVGRGKPWSFREPLPGDSIPAAPPSGIRALLLGVNHTKALDTELLRWALFWAAPALPSRSQQRAKHQNPAEKLCWTQQGKVGGSATKSWGALTPSECVQVGSLLSLLRVRTHKNTAIWCLRRKQARTVQAPGHQHPFSQLIFESRPCPEGPGWSASG